MFRRALNKLLGPLGLKLVPKHHDELLYQHDYGSGGYEAYRQLQIGWNKAKIDAVWADERTLKAIAEDVERRGLKTGLCHGARNGYEVEWFRKRLGTEVIGTDISDTATRFPNMVVQDFHEPRSEWLGKWDFIYTNSLDQAFDPRKALDTWSEQLGGGASTSNIRCSIRHPARRKWTRSARTRWRCPTYCSNGGTGSLISSRSSRSRARGGCGCS